MLKVSVLEDGRVITIKFEGRLAGLWTAEVDRTWTTLASSLGSRTVKLDLCDMTYADASGIQSLREIYEASDAAFITNTPLSKDFAAEAMRAREMVKEN